MKGWSIFDIWLVHTALGIIIIELGVIISRL